MMLTYRCGRVKGFKEFHNPWPDLTDESENKAVSHSSSSDDTVEMKQTQRRRLIHRLLGSTLVNLQQKLKLPTCTDNVSHSPVHTLLCSLGWHIHLGFTVLPKDTLARDREPLLDHRQLLLEFLDTNRWLIILNYKTLTQKSCVFWTGDKFERAQPSHVFTRYTE